MQRNVKLGEFLDEVLKSHANQLVTDLARPKKNLQLTGLTGSALALNLAAVLSKYKMPLLFIADGADEATTLAGDLQSLVEGRTINLFPGSFKKSFQYKQPDNSLILQRAEVLNRLADAKHNEIIVSWPEALAEMVLERSILDKSTYHLKVGDSLDIDFMIEFLNEHHFDRTDFVYEAGFFAIRGGIIDVFSFANPYPYRIELDGDKIETIREFNPADQLSTKRLDFFSLVPNIQTASVIQSRQSFFDYLPSDTIIFTKDLLFAQETLDKIAKKAEGEIISLETPEGDVFEVKSPDLFELTDDWMRRISSFKNVEYGHRTLNKNNTNIEFKTSPQPSFNKNFKLIRDDFKLLKEKEYKVYVFSDSARQIERLYSIFDDLDPEVEFEPVFHAITEGFVDHQMKVACYSEHQLFDRFYRHRGREQYSRNKAITLKELRDLKTGDYVTHADHGIGKFAGLEKMEMNGKLNEVVRLIYRDNDLLYVSINSLHKIAKYVGKDGTEPRLHKLGSDSWDKLKRNTKAKIKDIARDLIKIYAARKSTPGFSFTPDSYLQTELEASFIYEDTPDQAKATEDFKKDMESAHPMDRLICGDVGFGKTEVAVRAAFKAVYDSKQVAILVPTTILASQHYRTFRERLKDFPVSIDFLNRFRTATEQKDILTRLKSGKIDIIIGTHRILSKDMLFKDLGLLIVDEEQKFGVAAKEKLKQMRVNVDTLTLTATPIPRTLHFSLMGARDLSIINTPPPNRQPVTTEMHPTNDDIIRDAINEEIQRGGQSFVIHNRVRDIYELADKIRELCPKARVGVGHGQLEGHELEEVMIKFVEGEFDVLVATTIIESGLDISNANTIIINNAHMYGLSDIHQMRGRVGRSNKKAYCYLLVPSLSMLTEDARRRLSAVEEFSELGSGFNIAMRDLDIRGSGNLLGAEQSGFIAEIGYDMYHKILDEAVHELKDEEFADLFADEPIKEVKKDVIIETDVQMVIPDNYIRSGTERLSLYSELSNINKDEDLQKFAYKLKDRFGSLPPPVIDLLDGMKLKWAGQILKLEKVTLKNKTLVLYFPLGVQNEYYEGPLFGRVINHINANPSKYKLGQFKTQLTLTVQNVMGIPAAEAVVGDLGKYSL